MRCRHRRVDIFRREADGAVQLRCGRCLRLMPIGSANDTPEVEQEITAAEQAASVAHVPCSLEASLRMPTAWSRAAFRQQAWDEDFCRRHLSEFKMRGETGPWRAAYEESSLARAIYDHERGEPW